MKTRQVNLKCNWLMNEEGPAELIKWLVTEDTKVEIDQDLLLLLVNGEEVPVPAPIDGQLISILAEPGDIIEPDQVLAIIETI